MMSKLIVANVDEGLKNKGLAHKTIKSSTSLHQSTTTEGGQHEHH